MNLTDELVQQYRRGEYGNKEVVIREVPLKSSTISNILFRIRWMIVGAFLLYIAQLAKGWIGM